jgi:uncharacterized RDD family membrane protein YckC
VAAALIDIALLVPVAVVLTVLFGGFTGAAAALTAGWALYYYFALESGGGQTLGKRVMKLRVVRADGSPPDMGRVAVRTLLRPIDGIGAYLVGLVVMLATGQRRQRLGDLAAGTVVTEVESPPASADPEPLPATAEVVPAKPDLADEPAPLLEPDLAEPEAVDSETAEPEEPESPPSPAADPEPAPLPEPETAEPEAEHPATAEPEAMEPEASEPEESDEPQPHEPKPTSPLEIVSSPIELIMRDHDEEEEDRDGPPQA